MALQLDPDNPNHARLLALKADNRDLINALDEYGIKVNPLHAVDVKLALLIEQVIPGNGPARVEFETRFEATMHEEMEGALASARQSPPVPPPEPPVLLQALTRIEVCP